QFLIEAVVLTAIGGFLGLAGGELLSLLTNKYSPLPAYVTARAIGVGGGIFAAVGIVFGLRPGWEAGGPGPIEALPFQEGEPGAAATGLFLYPLTRSLQLPVLTSPVTKIPSRPYNQRSEANRDC